MIKGCRIIRINEDNIEYEKDGIVYVKKASFQNKSHVAHQTTIAPTVMPSNKNFWPLPSIDTSGHRKTYSFIGDGHWVKEKIDSGSFIQLEDKSLWEISPIDRINCSLWLSLDEIVVTESQNPNYPYLLINTDDDEKVEAKLISD